jgi:heme/copper-type cytochrome/quinol oxidase subunit 2
LSKIKDSSLLNLSVVLNAPVPYGVTFQDPATAVMEGIINFHYDLMFYLIFIIIFIFYIMVRIIVIFRVGSAYEEYKKQHYEYYQSITHNTSLEIA